MSNWFAPSLNIPDDARAEIKAWADAQDWPEGTKLKDPSSYHITVLYSSDAYGTEEATSLMKSASAIDWNFGVRVIGVEAFASGDTDGTATPVVLELAGGLLKIHAKSVMDEAEAMGIEVSRFDTGYRPHVTVAILPPGATMPEFDTLPGANASVGFPLKFDTDPEIVDLHAQYEAEKGR